MTETVWVKNVASSPRPKSRSEYLKFLIGAALMLAAVVYLIISGTASGARYFITIDDLVKNRSYVGQTVRVSGAVLGSSIQYDSKTLTIDFTVANIPQDTTDLARTLHLAVIDSSATRVRVHIENQVKPDLLKDEAQAIMTGKMGDDGIFYASELLLKCPSRYQENVPNQAVADA